MEVITLIIIIIIVIFIAVIVSAIWPTTGLIAFMSIYLVKGSLRLYFPFFDGFWGYLFDMGVLLLAFIGIITHYIKFGGRQCKLVPGYVWFSMAFLCLWVWLRLPISRNPQYGLIKALIFSIFNMSIILLGIFSVRTLFQAKKVIKAIIIIGICTLISILIFGNGQNGWEGARITLTETNPLAPADFAAYLIIILISYWLAKRKKIYALIIFIIVPLALITIFLTGSRGALFALPIVIFFIFYFYRHLIGIKLPIYFFILVFVLFGAISYVASEAVVENRMSSDSIQSGLTIRTQLTKITFVEWLASPILGTGTGDTSVQFSENGINSRYPHNVIFEVANELGIIGLVPFLLLLYAGVRSMNYILFTDIENSEIKECFVPLFGCFLYHFLLSFKTGSYAGSNMFYFFLGTIISWTELIKYYETKIEN